MFGLRLGRRLGAFMRVSRVWFPRFRVQGLGFRVEGFQGFRRSRKVFARVETSVCFGHGNTAGLRSKSVHSRRV